jgi:SAM-dependent methyltransferase
MSSILTRPILSLKHKLSNAHERHEFVIGELRKIKNGALILDAGCGSQRYRAFCNHLQYKGQDFGQYKNDDKRIIGRHDAGGEDGYAYGELDYIGDIWNILEKDDTFDAILCTEVIEHIPFPNETLAEFSRLLKPGGTLILTAPSNCLRHMDPYFFYTGFSDRWFEKILGDHGMEIVALRSVGDYYSWMAVEIARTGAHHSFLAKLALAPAFLYYHLKRKTDASVNTLCIGYHVVARKKY